MNRERKAKLARELRQLLTKLDHADRYDYHLSTLGDAVFDVMVTSNVGMQSDDAVKAFLTSKGVTVDSAKLYLEWLKEAYSE